MITACSSAEAGIYATDECAKFLLHLSHLISELALTSQFLDLPVTIFNDNHACVCWSHNLTTKGLRHIQMQENAVCESVQKRLVQIKHIAGANNPADLFTKEDKDVKHFISIQDQLVCVPPKQIQISLIPYLVPGVLSPTLRTDTRTPDLETK